MQISTALLFLLLTATSFTSQVLAHPEFGGRIHPQVRALEEPSETDMFGLKLTCFIPTSCCFTMTSKKIPNTLLKSYKRITNSRCSLKAILLKTKLDKEICADPKKKWVQDAIKHLDQKLQTPKP